MFYFKFTIPTNKDGATVAYSEGWCGTRDHCAKSEKGIYYNDKERWGIGIAEGDFFPPDVEVLTADKVAQLMGISDTVSSKAVIATDKEGIITVDGKAATLPEASEGVYFGTKLVERYLPEAEVIEEKEEIKTDEVYIPPLSKEPVNTFPRYCPTCHQLTAVITQMKDGMIKVTQNGKTLIEGIKTANLILTCPAGHKVKLTFAVATVEEATDVEAEA